MGICINENEINATYDIFVLLHPTHQKFQGKEENYLYLRGRFANKQNNRDITFFNDGREEGNDWKALDLFNADKKEFEKVLKNVE